MTAELIEFMEHLERYRAVTLQSLDLVDDVDLQWRPHPEMMTLGQQFLHIAQSEDFGTRAIFHGEWDRNRLRLPKDVTSTADLLSALENTRAQIRAALEGLDAPGLSRMVGQPPTALSSWLWSLLEHEVHHKAQIAMYLRLMGKTPPFFAAPLEDGSRPDVEAREKFGGV